MHRTEWVVRIRTCCQQAGTYRPYFEDVIATLADILERRDEVQKEFEESSAEIMVEYTNKGGATNMMQNPMLRMVNDLNRDALAYWRDLGLTPAGLKRIDEGAMKQRKKSALGEALKGLA